MAESEKIVEYKNQKKKNRLLSVMLSMSNAVTNLSNDEISKITLNERLQKLTTTSEDIKKEAKKLSVIYDKMKEIESSLNEDEKREYEQLGLLNDDEKS